MSVVDQLTEFLGAHKDLAPDPLAAAAMALAADIDAAETTAPARSASVTAFQKLMVELRGMAPAEKKVGKNDELRKRRENKLKRTSGA